jgi:hypothetical protein
MGAQQVTLPSVPVAAALPVHTRPPVAELVPVALPAKLVGFGKINQGSAGQPEFVAIAGIMAIQAPAMLLVVTQNDIGMFFLEHSTVRISFQVLVAFGAGIDAF